MIYLTYCSWQKDGKYKDIGIKTTPDKLYTSPRIKAFISECNRKSVSWAIFSDLYGVWFPNELHDWYDKSPDEVTEAECSKLIDEFNRKLFSYQQIGFYYDNITFHKLYREILSRTILKERIIMIEDLSKVGELV